MLHKNSEKWFSLSLPEQLGNVGSEVERVFAGRANNDSDKFESAKTRMLELFDLTLSDPRLFGPRLREIARLREFICLQLETPNERDIQLLRDDFLNYALLARRNR